MPGPGLTIEYTDPRSRRRRIRLERRAAGGWDRHEDVYRGGRWQPVGREIVADVRVQIDADVHDDLDILR